MKTNYLPQITIVCLTSILVGCSTTSTRSDNRDRGRPTTYESPDTPGQVSGIGLESQDIVSMTDRMVRDILANPGIAARNVPPRIVVDSEYFRNESSSIINKNLLTDRLRVDLVRAANGRLSFLARHQADATEDERSLEEDGVVRGGTQGPTKLAMGYDYRLGGRIASVDMVDSKTGLKSRYHQITFELIERGSGQIIWANKYELKKTAMDDILYR